MDIDNFKDPFDRLDDLEMVCTGLGLALQDLSQQLKSQSELGVKISSSMIELVRALDIATSKIAELEYRLELLEH